MDSSTSVNLLAQSKEGDSSALGDLLEHYRPYLRLMAARRLDADVQVRADPSDVVQASCLEAVRDFDGFRGTTTGEFAAWLRRIVDHNIFQTIEKHVGAQKRSTRKERSMDDSAGGTPLRAGLHDGASSPSQRLMRGEAAVLLAQHLEKLTDDQREAVRLRYLEGLPLAELAQRLDRSEEAASGLLKRGLRGLRISFSQS